MSNVLIEFIYYFLEKEFLIGDSEDCKGGIDVLDECKCYNVFWYWIDFIYCNFF